MSPRIEYEEFERLQSFGQEGFKKHVARSPVVDSGENERFELPLSAEELDRVLREFEARIREEAGCARGLSFQRQARSEPDQTPPIDSMELGRRLFAPVLAALLDRSHCAINQQ